MLLRTNFCFPTLHSSYKKRWQEYTEELYKKDLHDTDKNGGVIIGQQPDILEYEGKLALGKHHYEQK